MQIIGLTGSSGAGKGMAAACFAELGAGVVDADAVYHALCRTCHPMLDALKKAFGPVLTPTGTLDRPALARIVFADRDALDTLGQITTPYILKASQEAMDALRDHPLVLYDAPTLFQTGADRMCDAVIGVLAEREVRTKRIMARDGLTRQAACARIDAQPNDDFYRARCTYILENNASPAALGQACAALYKTITEGT